MDSSFSMNRTSRFFIFTSWILSYFRLADKDRSGTLTKRECRRLLTDSLNAKVPGDVFEKLFKV
jgi:Ca2+-binding EF-hand superfamily protein